MPEPVACPTPAKVRYATTITARQAADRDAAIHGMPHYPYPCRCGWWHTSTKPYDRALGVNRQGVVYLRKRKTKPTGN